MKPRTAVFLLLAATGSAASIAEAKFDLRLAVSTNRAVLGEQVRVTIRAPGESCPGMRVDVVSPETSIARALTTLEGGLQSKPIPHRAFRLASLRLTAPGRWEGAIRFGRPGRWRLVVPNFCAPGYTGGIPHGLQVVTVRRADASSRQADPRTRG